MEFGTLVYEENMFVFGGYTFKDHNGSLDAIRSYNPKTDTWTDRGRLLQTHYFHDVIFSSEFFLVLGDGEKHESEKCSFDGNSFVCEQQETIFGSVE